MNYVNEDILVRERSSVTSLLPAIGSAVVRREILEGLQRENKYISSKFFYNERGSELFEEITRLEEYYPTRTEKKILEDMAPGLMDRHPGHEIVELGSGDPGKISILLRAASRTRQGSIHYLPMDISQEALLNSAGALTREFPRVEVEAYVLDFLSQFEALERDQPLLICFLGSTIGNFSREAGLDLVRQVGRRMKPGDTFLLGMDLVKEESILHRAYNDARGVTREFNLNILDSVNELIGSDFQAVDFEHLAFYTAEKQRIEMHLVARRDLKVCSPHMEAPLQIRRGEHIHTENSHKYRADDIRSMALASGLRVVQTHRDPKNWFALTEFVKGA